MSVTLTDEKHAELVRMLDTIIRGCDARAYDIGLSLDPLRELLGDVAALTREPAPAVSSEFELSAFGKALLAGGTLEDAFAAEGVRLDPAPAPRPHRELMEEAREALVRSCAYVHENRSDIVTDNQELAQRIDAALASDQPCAAPGEAGEFEITEHVVRAMEPNGLVAIWDGKAPGPLKAGDRLVRYRRRAPEREGGAR